MAKGKNSHTRAPVRKDIKSRVRSFGPRSLVCASYLNAHMRAPDLRNPKWCKDGDVQPSGPRALLRISYLKGKIQAPESKKD